METGPCPACGGVLARDASHPRWACRKCGAVVARPDELKRMAVELHPTPPPLLELPPITQPRGGCPLCRTELALMDQEPWSLCPACRVRVVPREALIAIAQRPELAERTPLGIPGDHVGDTPHSRVMRVAVIAVLVAASLIVFKLPSTALEECQAIRADPTASHRARGRVCENWIWRDLAAGGLLFTAAGLGATLRRRELGPRGRDRGAS